MNPDIDARESIILINADEADVVAPAKKDAPKGRRYYIAQRNAEIVAAVKAGTPVTEIAATFGLSATSIYQTLRQDGVSVADIRPLRERREHPAFSERNKDIIEKYKSGLSAEQIGQEYGITRERVCQIIRPLLLPQLKAERARLAREALAAETAAITEEVKAERKAQIERAVQLVRDGASRNEAARQTGLLISQIQIACKAAGLPHLYGKWGRVPELEQRAKDIRRQRAEGKTWDEIGQSNYAWAVRHLPDIIGQHQPRRRRKGLLATLASLPEAPPPPNPWTPEKEEALCRMYFDGCSAQHIADVLGEGFTRNAVIGKTNRLRAQKLLQPPQKKE